MKWNIIKPTYKAIDITEIQQINQEYRNIEKDLANNKCNYKIEFNNECCELNNTNIIKILKLLANKGMLARYGTFIFKRLNSSYAVANIEGSKRVTEYLNKNRISLHKLVYCLFYGNQKNVLKNEYHIHHLCKNPNCLNPNHLIAVHKTKHKLVEQLTVSLLNNQQLNFQLKEQMQKELGTLYKRIIQKTKDYIL